MQRIQEEQISTCEKLEECSKLEEKREKLAAKIANKCLKIKNQM